MCLCWIFFYGSIKLGDSASITLACLGSVSFFSSILEPIVLNKQFSKPDICLGAVVIVGIMFIYFSLPADFGKNSDSQANSKLAILAGMVAACLCSAFSVLNKKYISITTPLVMSAIEMGAGAALLTVVVPCMYGKVPKWYPGFDPYHLS